MARANSFVLITFAVLAFTAPKAPAQDPAFAGLYGQAVHAYFAGNLSNAYDTLTVVINGRALDPRAFYYRGFVNYRRGSLAEADSDFRSGAILEVSGNGGPGVAAYFTNDLEKAHEMLTASIAQGTKDASIYYFRGLNYEKLGRFTEAKSDFDKAAELGFRGHQETAYPVAQALQRIQGGLRLRLEAVRRQVRLASQSNMAASQQ